MIRQFWGSGRGFGGGCTGSGLSLKRDDLVDGLDGGVAAALRLADGLGVAAALGKEGVDIKHGGGGGCAGGERCSDGGGDVGDL